jgi:hypothetical protein
MEAQDHEVLVPFDRQSCLQDRALGMELADHTRAIMSTTVTAAVTPARLAIVFKRITPIPILQSGHCGPTRR